MTKDQVNKQRIIENLYEIDPGEIAYFPADEHAGWDDFGKGLIVGTVETLMACGLEFEAACDVVKSCFTDKVRRGAIPPIWHEIFADYIVEPPVPELLPVIQFLADQDCEIEYPDGRQILFTTPNALAGCVMYEKDGTFKETIDGDTTIHPDLQSLKDAWK